MNSGIEQKMKVSRPRLVAIVGGSGAGKTWLAETLSARLGKLVSRLSLDDFYHDRSHLSLARRAQLNFDHPRSIDWQKLETVLAACLSGKKVRLPQYDFATHARKKISREWAPRPVILVEGLWLLHRRSLRSLFDFSIYVECGESTRLERRLIRDCRERGRTQDAVLQQFSRQVSPMHQQFVEPQKRWADVVFSSPGSRQNLEEILPQVWPGRKNDGAPIAPFPKKGRKSL